MSAINRYSFRNIKSTVFEKGSKVLILGQKKAYLTHFGRTKDFSQNKSRAPSIFRACGTIISCKKSEKINEPLFSTRRYIHTGSQTDGRTRHRKLWQNRGSKKSFSTLKNTAFVCYLGSKLLILRFSRKN